MGAGWEVKVALFLHCQLGPLTHLSLSWDHLTFEYRTVSCRQHILVLLYSENHQNCQIEIQIGKQMMQTWINFDDGIPVQSHIHSIFPCNEASRSSASLGRRPRIS